MSRRGGYWRSAWMMAHSLSVRGFRGSACGLPLGFALPPLPLLGFGGRNRVSPCFPPLVVSLSGLPLLIPLVHGFVPPVGGPTPSPVLSGFIAIGLGILKMWGWVGSGFLNWNLRVFLGSPPPPTWFPPMEP